MNVTAFLLYGFKQIAQVPFSGGIVMCLKEMKQIRQINNKAYMLKGKNDKRKKPSFSEYLNNMHCRMLFLSTGCSIS